MKNYSVLQLTILLVSSIVATFVSSKGALSTQQNPGEGGNLRFSTGGLDKTCTIGGLGNQCDWTRTEFIGTDNKAMALMDNGLSATGDKTNLTASLLYLADYDTNDLGIMGSYLQSYSTTTF